MFITQRIEFDSAHRVLGHEGKCRFLHGHRYAAEISVEAEKLDNLSMVIDFSFVKERVGGWINSYWDHNILLHPNDPLIKQESNFEIFSDKKPYVMRKGNPTAENIAEELAAVTINLLPFNLRLISVKIYETPNCSATWTV